MWEISIKPWQWQSHTSDQPLHINSTTTDTKNTTERTKKHLIKAKATIESLLSSKNDDPQSQSSPPTPPPPPPSTDPPPSTHSPPPTTTTTTATPDLSTDSLYGTFMEGGRTSRTTLAHVFAHAIADATPSRSRCYCVETTTTTENDDGGRSGGGGGGEVEIEMDCEIMALSSVRDGVSSSSMGRRRRRRGKNSSNSSAFPPFVFERSDVWCDEVCLHVDLIMYTIEVGSLNPDHNGSSCQTIPCDTNADGNVNDAHESPIQFVQKFLQRITSDITENPPLPTDHKLLCHVATVVFQRRLRAMLPSLNAVSFIADGSILPRKSGASVLPMASPPAIPFYAPVDSPMTKIVSVPMGKLRPFLKLPTTTTTTTPSSSSSCNATTATTRGMIIPTGVTLIVGGGYHGKSTLLRTIASAVYDRTPNDGREFCATVPSATTVRAEDGRYVHSTNVSAFLSHLPSTNSNNNDNKTADNGTNATKQFQTNEASGSTSQAANVSESLESKSTTLLVDEDVSAANFLSRDGRMRALVQNESITPLLYRVNGIFESLAVSTVIVVGGVGDWLDVPTAVVMMDAYRARDVLEKARSVSRQFSYGHVEYKGRGVVHRLDWDWGGSPGGRRVVGGGWGVGRGWEVSLLDGGGKILICDDGGGGDENYEDGNVDGDTTDDDHYHHDDDDDDLGTIDMTRCEQLLGGKYQLYGCGICALWILRAAAQQPNLDLNALLDNLEAAMDDDTGATTTTGGGIAQIVQSVVDHYPSTHQYLATRVGLVVRPRRYEVAMAVMRMRGLKFEMVPAVIDDSVEQARLKEEERRKKALAELWENRRKKKNNNN